MRIEHTIYLKDPVTHEPLTLQSFAETDEHVMSGFLQAGESWYPIINGVPRLLTDKLRTNFLARQRSFFTEFKEKLPSFAITEWQAALATTAKHDAFTRHQQRTGDSFAYEWNTIYQENDFEMQNFLHFLHPFVKANDLQNMVLLDAGCGSGRFTKQAARCGAKLVVGSDVGESVEFAFNLTRTLPNVCIVQADIYSMPFHREFDLTYSIGVLHHLPQPEGGFQALIPTIREGGTMLIWVYNRRHNFRAIYIFETLRLVTRHIPPAILYKLGYLPAFGVHLCNYLTHGLKKLGLPRLAAAVPFSYYANFPFNMKLNDAFDVFATPKSNYYFVEQIQKWFAHAHLKNNKTFEHPEAGITAIGTYAP